MYMIFEGKYNTMYYQEVHTFPYNFLLIEAKVRVGSTFVVIQDCLKVLDKVGNVLCTDNHKSLKI